MLYIVENKVIPMSKNYITFTIWMPNQLYNGYSYKHLLLRQMCKLLKDSEARWIIFKDTSSCHFHYNCLFHSELEN